MLHFDGRNSTAQRRMEYALLESGALAAILTTHDWTELRDGRAGAGWGWLLITKTQETRPKRILDLTASERPGAKGARALS